MLGNMKWQDRWEEIAYQVLKDDAASFIHLMKHDRKRIAKKIGMEIAKEMGYHS